MWSSRVRGFTIVETMVFCTIVLLLMGCIVMVVQGGMRYLRLGTAYQDAQSQTLVGMRRMLQELGECSVAQRAPASPLADADHVIALWPQPEAPATLWTYKGSELEYHQWVGFYRDAQTNDLVRATQRIAGAPVASRDAPPAPPLDDFLLSRNPSARVLARGITDLRINDGPTGQQLSIRLTGSVVTGTDKHTAITHRSVVTLANP